MTKIYISSCVLFRQGTKDGRDWKLYHITNPKGVIYGTFSDKYSGLVGQEIEAEIEEKTVEKNGRTYKNLNIIEPKSRQNSQGFGQIIAALDLVLKNQTTIIGMLSDLEAAEEISPPDEGPTGTDEGGDNQTPS